MSHRVRALLTFLTAIVDAVMAAWAFYLAYQLRSIVPFPTPLNLGPFTSYLGQMFIHVASILVVFFLYRLYHLRRGGSRIDLVYTLISAVSIATLAATAVTYLVYQSESDLTRGLIIYSWGLTVILIAIGRVLTDRLRQFVRSKRPDHLLIVGTGDVGRMILQKTLQSPNLGYKVIGFIDGQNGREVAGVPVLGTQADMERIVHEYDVEEVVITLPEASHAELLDMISECEGGHARVRIFPDLFQILASEMSIDDLDGLPLLTVRDIALRGWKLTVKRMMDLVVSGLGLMFLSPFLLFIALLIKLESRGPVFYSHIRVGLDGNPFPILKFRSMRTDAEDNSGPVWATRDDPRRTRLGTFLRKSSIDELPQLINVLLGDMSLVGPRPERPMFVDQFKQVVPRYMERHKEKAGITGWAQVNGLRGDTSIVERTKYDLYYIENWSLLFDLKIILRTVLNQFRGDRNAY